MLTTKKIPLFSVVKKFKGGVVGGSMVNKEVSSWKLGARIKQQIKNPFKSAFICVLFRGVVCGF